MTLHEELLPLAARAERSLSNCRAFLEAKLETVDGKLVWIDQPDKGPPHLGSYGASCAAIGLFASGSPQDDDLIRRLLDNLSTSQLDSGGWTIRNAHPIGLTTSTAFALIAFGLCGIESEQEKNTVSKAAEWLVKNARHDGWAFFEGGNEVSIVATALAVRALQGVKPYIPAGGMQIIKQGCASLERAMHQDGYWLSRGDPNKGSVAGTSHVLISLVNSNYPIFVEPLQQGLSWLRGQDHLVHDNTDSFYAIRPDRSSAHVNYVHFTPALVLQAFLNCEADIVNEVSIPRLVEHLLSMQTEDGDWRSPLAPRQTPSWMIMDGALALSSFLKAVSATKASLVFRDEIVRVRADLKVMTERLNNYCGDFDKRLGKLEGESLAHSRKLSLLSWASVVIRLALPILAIFSLIVVYVYIRPHLQNQGLTDLAAVVLSVILTVISVVYTIIYAKRQPETLSFNEELYSDKGETPLLANRQPSNEILRGTTRETVEAKRGD